MGHHGATREKRVWKNRAKMLIVSREIQRPSKGKSGEHAPSAVIKE